MARQPPSTDAATPRPADLTPASVQLLALYLPQFHPIPENDEFWGAGFTEWTSTAAATPRFPNHRQPRRVGELGMYDLRNPDVVRQQESLATQYGIDAFVYYHYWFEGRRVMGGPLDAKRADATLTMPFALCWANHDWNRNQNGVGAQLLIEQRYSESDDLDHVAFLADAFADDRYLRTDGRPVFFMYRTQEHPAPARFADLLREQCRRGGVDDPFLVRFETNGSDDIDPARHHFDAGADLHPHWLWHTPDDQRPERLSIGMPDDLWMRYDSVAATSSARRRPAWTRFPCVVPDWDTTARRPLGGANALYQASPLGYETWLAREVNQQLSNPHAPRMVVLNAWNEWSECGYLEPDAEQGRALLEATARAKGLAEPQSVAPAVHRGHDSTAAPRHPVTLAANDTAAETDLLILELVPAPCRVLHLRAESSNLTGLLVRLGNSVTVLHNTGPVATPGVTDAVEITAIDLDRIVLSEHLRGREFECVLITGVLAHVRSATRLLTDALSLLTPDGSVIIVVPNIAHVDARLMLLEGRWVTPPGTILDEANVRLFTRDSLLSLLRDCGLVATDWQRTVLPVFGAGLGVEPNQAPPALLDQIASDPDATTSQYIVSARRADGAELLARTASPRVRIDIESTDLSASLQERIAQLDLELEAYRQLTILRVTRLPRALYARLTRWRRRSPP